MNVAGIEAADRAWCEATGIHYCEPGHPWVKGTGRALHPHAAVVPDNQRDGWSSADAIRVHCPVCGITWTEELPQ